MIEIRKISITDLDTDAVVNAANEGLWVGSGVCGAIFDAAGYEELEAAWTIRVRLKSSSPRISCQIQRYTSGWRVSADLETVRIAASCR